MLAALSLVVEREMVNCQFKLSVSWHFSVPHRTPPAKFSAQGQPWVYLRQRVNAREMRDELGTQLSRGTSLAMVKNLQEIQRKDTETHNGKTTAKKRKKKSINNSYPRVHPTHRIRQGLFNSNPRSRPSPAQFRFISYCFWPVLLLFLSVGHGSLIPAAAIPVCLVPLFAAVCKACSPDSPHRITFLLFARAIAPSSALQFRLGSDRGRGARHFFFLIITL